jgi:hypothetical protein
VKLIEKQNELLVPEQTASAILFSKTSILARMHEIAYSKHQLLPAENNRRLSQVLVRRSIGETYTL